MADRIDALMHPVQARCPHPGLNRASAQSNRGELGSGHQAVLLGRHIRDLQPRDAFCTHEVHKAARNIKSPPTGASITN